MERRWGMVERQRSESPSFCHFPARCLFGRRWRFPPLERQLFPPDFRTKQEIKTWWASLPAKETKKLAKRKKVYRPKCRVCLAPLETAATRGQRLSPLLRFVSRIALTRSFSVGPLDSLPHTFISRVREHRKHRGSKRVGYAFPLVCSDLIVFVHVSMGVKTSIRNGSIHARIPPTNSWR